MLFKKSEVVATVRPSEAVGNTFLKCVTLSLDCAIFRSFGAIKRATLQLSRSAPLDFGDEKRNPLAIYDYFGLSLKVRH